MYEESIKALNQAIADEMWAIHQYMYFHFHCDDQGFDPLAALFKKTAIEEMFHTERLAERVLFLKGGPAHLLYRTTLEGQSRHLRSSPRV